MKPRRVRELPTLSNLLGAHFNLDWDLDHETSDDVLRDWVVEAGTPDRLRALVDDVTRWLSWDDDRAEAYLLRCTTWIDREGEYGDRGFLMHVRAVARDELPEQT